MRCIKKHRGEVGTACIEQLGLLDNVACGILSHSHGLSAACDSGAGHVGSFCSGGNELLVSFDGLFVFPVGLKGTPEPVICHTVGVFISKGILICYRGPCIHVEPAITFAHFKGDHSAGGTVIF